MIKIQDAMSDLLDVADARLTKDVNIAFLAPGAEVAWDDCCDDNGTGGQLWVRVVNMAPSLPFPRVDNEQKCGVTMVAATLGVGVVRCAHTLNDSGESPTAAQMTADASQINQDASDLLDAIMQDYKYKVAVTTWTPQGPDGGCAGGEWQVIVALLPCT